MPADIEDAAGWVREAYLGARAGTLFSAARVLARNGAAEEESRTALTEAALSNDMTEPEISQVFRAGWSKGTGEKP